MEMRGTNTILNIKKYNQRKTNIKIQHKIIKDETWIYLYWLLEKHQKKGQSE